MSKFQIPYEQAKRRMIMNKVPEIQKQIQDLQVKMAQTSNPDEKKGLRAEIDALNIKIKSFRKNDPVREEVENEEAQGAVTTGNVGSSTMSTSDGGTVPAAFGSSHIYAPSMGMFKRRGYTPPKESLPKGKKKKKKIREFVEFYNQD